jgi:predicted methyltransferase
VPGARFPRSVEAATRSPLINGAGARFIAAIEASELQKRKSSMRHWNLLAAAAFAVTTVAVAAPSPTISAAVQAPTREADNVKLDESRKPGQVLGFLGLKPGMKVLDLFGLNAYWAEITAPVVGPRGHVTVWEPTQFYKGEGKDAFAAFMAKHPNVSIVTSPFEAPNLPKNYADLVIINLDYHDTYWQSEKYGIPKMDPGAFVKAVYTATKPGGIVGVTDHVANPGDTRATVEKLHRIDPKTVKADFTRAGFVLAGSSDVLRNPADDHSLLVFDPKIRGKTDRFIFKFRKPR